MAYSLLKDIFLRPYENDVDCIFKYVNLDEVFTKREETFLSFNEEMCYEKLQESHLSFYDKLAVCPTSIPAITICLKKDAKKAFDFAENVNKLFATTHKVDFTVIFAEELLDLNTSKQSEENQNYKYLLEFYHNDKGPVFVIYSYDFVLQTEINLKMIYLFWLEHMVTGSTKKYFIPVYFNPDHKYNQINYLFKHIRGIRLYIRNKVKLWEPINRIYNTILPYFLKHVYKE